MILFISEVVVDSIRHAERGGEALVFFIFVFVFVFKNSPQGSFSCIGPVFQPCHIYFKILCTNSSKRGKYNVLKSATLSELI